MTLPPNEPSFAFQLQHALAVLGQAENQCHECGVFCADGGKPWLHKSNCESSGTAEKYRRFSEPTAYGPKHWDEDGPTP